MSNERLMTIKELADELKVSKDKIKYRVGKLPSNYLVKKHGITYLNALGIEAIREMMGVNYPGNYPPNSPSFTHSEKLVEMLQKELEQKNQQIDNLMKLLDHEQHLRMVVEQKLLPDISVSSDESEEIKQENLASSTDEPPEKKWWQIWK